MTITTRPTLVNASLWFIFYKDQLLIEKRREEYTLPYGILPPLPLPQKMNVQIIDMPEGISAKAFFTENPVREMENYIWTDLRNTYYCLPEKLHKLAGKAFEILYWDKCSQFCPACGTKTLQTTLISKQCPDCKQEFYPAISTAVLALVRKEDSILLVHARNFKGTFYSLVAGFLETGETLEECVEREIKEETGLRVKNITYFGNQAWPYPSGLMVGFVADYESGTLTLQEEELSAGSFYTRDNLPELPRQLSLARQMIDWWVAHP